MLDMQVGDIGGDTNDRIKVAFKRQGIDNPTDAQIINTDWFSKTARK